MQDVDLPSILLECLKHLNLHKEVHLMNYHSTVLGQLLRFIPRDFFQKTVRKYRGDKGTREFNSWTHLASLIFAQLTGQQSVRDLETALYSRRNDLYHAGMKPVKRSTFCDANRKRSHEIFQEVYYEMLSGLTHLGRRLRFRFKNPVKILDSTVIDLCLSVFSWAEFRQRKGALKLHCEYDLDSQIPTFIRITTGKIADIKAVKSRSFEKGSILVFDRGYVDYCWFHQLDLQGVYFVTRAKRNMLYRVVGRNPVNKKSGLRADQIIRITGHKADCIPILLRRIVFVNPEDNQRYVFLTNIMHLAASTIAEIYKCRWQIELFFKWIKQNLKIKTFLGTTKNAVMSQIWAALILFLLLSFMRIAHRINWTLHKLMVFLKLNALEPLELSEVLLGIRASPQSQNVVQMNLAF